MALSAYGTPTANGMLMQKKRFGIFLVLTIVAISATIGFFWSFEHFKKNVDTRQIDTGAVQNPDIDLESPQNHGESSGNKNQNGDEGITSKVQSTPSQKTYQQIGPNIKGLPQMESPEVEVWRENNIVPDLTELDSYLEQPIVDLKEAAEGGDVLAQIALGNKLIREEYNADEGIDWLIEAASHGSQEALRNLRWVYQFGAGEIEPDPYAFLAWSKVAYMLGDWQALWPFGTKAISEIGVKNSIIIEIMAANYFAEINDRHVYRTGRNMSISLRPGYETALRQFMNESD